MATAPSNDPTKHATQCRCGYCFALMAQFAAWIATNEAKRTLENEETVRWYGIKVRLCPN